ncbi:2-polyprenyl-6-methoxyphenol hydroxylase-like FAD-dependent oxidoreductase [Natrinema hispanicum]|uniref:2-polyprenyl-6-methoxyphenol hydroxylase-like FAD-dependent oxidoreductase n=1 Tax=Natrinema hispanicum TaxID=392421 RepID=A0A482YEA6_9EURY|nr:FAD-dependent monooxygenase [Natrinema hispanicum]RZV08648.1 2-polyprenyl-6-methoxyphenol hydroxylase-like FAD-dependent oxidoreductase [Natrinema hispanicum]
MTLANIARYDERRAPSIGQRAVVVGGSVAGLCAARVLRDSFAEVVVLERDEIPNTPVAREGAPQTSQPHAMLEAGRTTLEDFFPGFGNAIQSAGGLQLDMSKDFVWYEQGGAVAEATAELPALYASRPLFEHVIRERVREFDEVQLRGGCRVLGYEHDTETERVTGVRFRDENGQETTLEAPLVVDATGRQSRTPTWLEAHGYPVPDVDAVEIDVTYSTVRIDRPPAVRGGVLVAPEPHRPRGAAMLPIEDDQWEVILQGIHGEQAPADRETVLEWAETLPRDEIGRRLREQEWVSGTSRYPFPSSIRRHYASLDRFPKGLVVTGDALASFNPIYGQGMSVATLDALALHHELEAGFEGLGSRFFRRTDEIIDEAWKIAVGKDFMFDETTGPKPFGTDLFNTYVARLLRRAHDDGNLTEAFFRVFRLERSATSLLRPSVVWRVLRPRFGSTTANGSETAPASSSMRD